MSDSATALNVGAGPHPQTFRGTMCRIGTGWRFSVVFATVMSFAGCTPAFNWREVPLKGVVALFPDRPQSATRRVPILTQTVSMTMTGTESSGMTFVVSVVDWPSQREGDAQSAQASIEASLLKAVGAQAVNADNVTIKQAGSGATVPARSVKAQGSARGKPVKLWAVFANQNGRLIEAEVIGPVDDTPEQREAADTFISGLRLN